MAEKAIRQHIFEPGAMSIIQMGEELIGHPSTAVNELVKNGYDADAQNCGVYFHYDPVTSRSFAIIYDDGSGMDEKTLFGDWLKPSVSKKRTLNAKSEIYERHLLGSKGIGRLAAMALGEYVTVVSRKKPNQRFCWITINRELFRQDKLLSKIKFPGDEIENYFELLTSKKVLETRNIKHNENLTNFLKNADLNTFSKGTLIIIEHLDETVLKILKDNFSQTELLSDEDETLRDTDFYKSIATLITPLELNKKIQKELLEKKIIGNEKIISLKDSSFQVEFGTNLLPNQTKNIIDWQKVESIPIQTAYDYRVYGKVSEEGNVSGYMSYHRLVGEKYDEKFEISFEDIFEDDKKDNSNQFDIELNGRKNKPETGEYYFDLRVYDIGEKDNLEKLAKEAKLQSGSKFRSAFKKLQGLRISKNGFGVKPYGEEVEDWIGLSKARVQNPGQNVNTNQILGYVYFYSPVNDNLEEKTNREGFLENKAFIRVKTTLSIIFKNLGRRRYNFRLLHGIGRIPESKHQRPRLEEFLETINTYTSDKNIISYSEKFMKEVGTSLDNLEESLSFSERLASLGAGIELVYHEMAQPISGLRTTESSLGFKKEKIDQDALESFISDLNTLEHSTSVLVELRKSLQPAIGRTRRKAFKPCQTFLKVCNLFKSDTEDSQIKIVIDERLEDYKITDLEYAFWITFLNIINNAVYWIKKSNRPGEIRFHLENNDLVVSNSGPKINEKIIDHIFSYGVTTRQEKNATGLGLAFTQSILSRNKWEISAENRQDGPAFIIKKDEDG
ncbi:sensor histidine kinase [Ulvibacterium marinum]|uniref:Histidine kinase domain-containing protein n=1 Tax=Ulvibacterium marinum TaxID=2419782 RepID=A0A3B0CB27_9FLAO|nr:sensor histidine kinase [Ulvibacterium marinum]RKN81209.1 hypothetical protein D7Z94_09720 [Ulvibacterium marinum]